MQRCQPVDVSVVDVGSLPEQRRHLLLVAGGAGGHKHGSLREPDLRAPRPGAARGVPGLGSRPIRVRAQPSLQLILPTLFGSFGPGMVSGRHLPWSVPDTFSSWYEEQKRSGGFGLSLSSPGLRRLVETLWSWSRELQDELLSEWQPHAAFRCCSEMCPPEESSFFSFLLFPWIWVTSNTLEQTTDNNKAKQTRSKYKEWTYAA